MVFYSGDTSSNPAEVNLVFSVKILIEKYKLIEKEAVVVAQLILRSLPTPEIQMVERVIDKLYLRHHLLCLLGWLFCSDLRQSNAVNKAGGLGQGVLYFFKMSMKYRRTYRFDKLVA